MNILRPTILERFGFFSFFIFVLALFMLDSWQRKAILAQLSVSPLFFGILASFTVLILFVFFGWSFKYYKYGLYCGVPVGALIAFIGLKAFQFKVGDYEMVGIFLIVLGFFSMYNILTYIFKYRNGKYKHPIQ